ncbi:CbtA family protein [Halosegnis sp.]|uniref:CbtA family protein n=1 Tax=Halosegnis sp. TaxID=2864959 RepID=UPI0035D44352
MLAGYATRGLKAGAAAGAAFGAYVALVGNPLVRHAEAVTTGHAHVGEAGTLLGSATSVAAGSLWGLLAGLCFGVAYYLAEPALPGGAEARSYLLAAAGFVTLAGAPWLVLPPQPAGVEPILGADTRLAWYGGMIVAGGLACGLALAAYKRTRGTRRASRLAAAAAPFALPLGLAAVAPATASAGDPALAAVYRGVVGLGQVLLWGTLAATHAWLCRRSPLAPTVQEGPAGAD